MFSKISLSGISNHVYKRMVNLSWPLMILLLVMACKKEETYSVQGMVMDPFGTPVQMVTITGNSQQVLSDEQGNWQLHGLKGTVNITPRLAGYEFQPENKSVSRAGSDLVFIAHRKTSSIERRILNWFRNQQLSNGLLESVEKGNIVSLYDNALAAMVFLLDGDIARAEDIFDFFDARINSELLLGPGGFSQFRDANGVPGYHRWMGDNAWLLIALNNYKALTGRTQYDRLHDALQSWLIGLQDADGGLWAGYASDNSRLNYKVTEGNIDAYNAIAGYTQFHRDLLKFLEEDRWDSIDRNLVSWPGNPKYLYALDCHSWSYCIFNDYPVSSLYSAQRFFTTQTATLNGAVVHGYDIDEDRDAVFVEGTGQMALAFHVAGSLAEKDQLLAEIEKIYTVSAADTGAAGFPYATNRGTGYGSTPLWQGADTKIAISAGAWYLFAYYGFNPFASGRKTGVPQADMFWLD